MSVATQPNKGRTKMTIHKISITATKFRKFTTAAWVFSTTAFLMSCVMMAAGFDDAARGGLFTTATAGTLATLCTLALGFRSLVVER